MKIGFIGLGTMGRGMAANLHNRGWGGRDSQSFLVLQQERAGVPPFALTAEQMEEVIVRS